MEEHDTVVLTRDLPEHGLEKGDVGAIVHRYGAGEGFEVEFVRASGETVAVVTLTEADLQSMEGSEIRHVRRLASA